MAHEFWINEQRSRGTTHGYLEKSDERIYFSQEDAQQAIDKQPETAPFRSTQRMVAMSREEWDEGGLVISAFMYLPAWLRRCLIKRARQSKQWQHYTQQDSFL